MQVSKAMTAGVVMVVAMVVVMVGVVEGTGLASVALVVPVVTTTGITASTTLTAAGTAAAAASVALGATAVALAASKRGNTKTSYGRHRRAIRDQKVEEALAVVASVDTKGCGMRHVCEIFKKPKNTLTPTENTIRLFIGEKPQPASPSDNTHPSVMYESAAILGLHGMDCYDLYRACPLSHAELNDYLATLDLTNL